MTCNNSIFGLHFFAFLYPWQMWQGACHLQRYHPAQGWETRTFPDALGSWAWKAREIVFGFNGFSENFLSPICFRMLSGEFAGILWHFGSTSGGTSLSSFCDTLLEKICWCNGTLLDGYLSFMQSGVAMNLWCIQKLRIFCKYRYLKISTKISVGPRVSVESRILFNRLPHFTPLQHFFGRESSQNRNRGWTVRQFCSLFGNPPKCRTRC